jgi:chromosome partitioning protein
LEAAKHGSVYFVDIDPQKSLTVLCHRRDVKGKDLFEDNPALLGDVGSLGSAVETLKRTDFGRDFIVADTPGSMMPVIRDAIAAADCIILPIQESPLDLFAQEDAVQYIIEAGKRDIAFFVMNRIVSPNINEFIAHISPVFPNPPVRIAQRLTYARALTKGRSAAESDDKAAVEISNLWEAVEKVLKKGEEHEHERNKSANGRPEEFRA